MRSVRATGSTKFGGWKSRGRHSLPSLPGRYGRLAPVAGLGALAAIGVAALAIAPFATSAGPSASALHAQSASLLTTNGGLDARGASPLRSPHLPGPRPSAHVTPTTHARQQQHDQQPAAAPSQPTVNCSLNATGMLPANYATIVSFLVAHGYTGNAAAGIAGNIYQESGGDPESIGSGGGGLIGWTPLPSGYVTGNPAADLQTQLSAILSFNQIWAQYIPALNAAASPAEAADIYVTDFERAGIPAASNREAAAQAVAGACGI